MTDHGAAVPSTSSPLVERGVWSVWSAPQSRSAAQTSFGRASITTSLQIDATSPVNAPLPVMAWTFVRTYHHGRADRAAVFVADVTFPAAATPPHQR